MMKKSYSILLAILITGCQREVKVAHVNDGDTFVLSTGEQVRLLGIDAPEIGEPGGDIAKHFLEGLVLGKKVRLEKDTTDRDKYNRLLRYVYVGDIFINAELVKRGYTIAKFYPPDEKYKANFLALEALAKQNRYGLWACGVFGDVTPTLQEETISWEEAYKYYNQVKVVTGKIVRTYNSGRACFLNFDFARSFAVVIFSSDFNKFPAEPEKFYLHKKVRVRGLIKQYQGKPEIILRDKSQIEIIG